MTGNISRNCPDRKQQVDMKRRKRLNSPPTTEGKIGVRIGPRYCSLQNTTTHGDDECFATISSKNTTDDLADVSADGADDSAVGIVCNNDIDKYVSQANVISLVVDSRATKGCVDPVLYRKHVALDSNMPGLAALVENWW